MNRKLLLIVILTPVTLFLLALLGAIGWLFFSSGPLELIAEGLRKDGVVITGVKGSLNSGIKFDKLEYRVPEMNLEIEGVEFKYSGLGDLLFNHSLIIENIQTTNAKIEILKLASGAPSRKQSRSGQASNPTTEPRQPRVRNESWEKLFDENQGGLREFRIKRVALGNIRVQSPLQERALDIEKATLSQFLVKKQHVSVEAFELLCSMLSFKGGQILFEGENLNIGEAISGSIKPAAFPMIKKDMAFELLGNLNVKSKSGEGHFKAFDGKLTLVMKKDGSVQMTSRDLTPSDFLNTSFPLSKMDVQLYARSIEAAMLETTAKGAVSLGKVRFQLEPMNGVHPPNSYPEQRIALVRDSVHGAYVQGASRIDLFFNPLVMIMGGKQGAVDLKSNFSNETLQILSFLNYGQYVQNTTLEQIGILKEQLNWFVPTGELAALEPQAILDATKPPPVVQPTPAYQPNIKMGMVPAKITSLPQKVLGPATKSGVAPTTQVVVRSATASAERKPTAVIPVKAKSRK